MLKGIFSVCFLFYFDPSTNRCPSLQGIGKPPWSLWLNLCLKFAARLRDLTEAVHYKSIEKVRLINIKAPPPKKMLTSPVIVMVRG
jgi:hypothetical protein